MTDFTLVPAAQYVRMSTEHQQYSIPNQQAVISQYAETHDFTVVRTYSDSGKSGVSLRTRPALRELLQDVTAGTLEYRAILVYDVSRWGRFQDTDESAHYEFLCKSAGIPIHYCAETFTNDGTMPSSIIKTLKRAMAGEYSRELGERVLKGQVNLARLGFKQGGAPGYGLRRLLISSDRRPKQILCSGERKSIVTDRVILIPGPHDEVEVVRTIYRMFVREGRSIAGIVRELNRQGIPFLDGKSWSHCSVMAILTHPKYVGTHVFNRRTMRLGASTTRTSRSDWVVKPGAFVSIVDENTFARAQRILENLTIRKSNEQILETLRTLLASEGRLTTKIIEQSLDTPSANTLERRFGGILQAYELIGYDVAREVQIVSARRRIHALRTQLLSKICELFPQQVRTVRRSGRHRARLVIKDRSVISVLIARYVWQEKKWVAIPIAKERRCVTLLARLDEQNKNFLDFRIFRRIVQTKRIYMRANSKFLNEGIRLVTLSEFWDAARKIRASA
jgi:DNA invertase Pin-like site-specific DNA recombinase